MPDQHQKISAPVTNSHPIAQHAGATGVSLPAQAPFQWKEGKSDMTEGKSSETASAIPTVQRFALPHKPAAVAAPGATNGSSPQPWHTVPQAAPSARLVPSQPLLQRFSLQIQSPAPVIAAGKVAQLTSAQIRLTPRKKIVDIIIRGRPPRVYSDSMGDHTTAFIIQTEGINIALQGGTLADAIRYMTGLTEHLKALPGLKYLDENSGIASRFYNELKTLEASLVAANEANTSGDVNILVSNLQQAIGAYLDARELVPFSTVNVGAKSKGTAGRGHGESRGARILSAFEREEAEVDADTLLEAVYSLFDDRSAGLAAVEKNPFYFSLLTGGGVDEGKLKDINTINEIWTQHRLSIAKLFPKVYATIGKELEKGDFTENLNKIKQQNIRNLIDEVTANLGIIHKDANMLGARFNYKSTPLKGNDINVTHLTSITELYSLQRFTMDQMQEIYLLNKELNNEFTGNIDKLHKEFENVKQEVSRTVPQYRAQRADVDDAISAALEKYTGERTEDRGLKDNARNALTGIKDYKGNNPFNLFEPEALVWPEEEEATTSGESEEEEAKRKHREKAPGKPTLSSQLSSMAIQIILNAEGNIGEMLSSGRPPSPFSKTMGAHTTAWVVHLDRVRTRIIGRSIAEAARALREMSNEVMVFASQRAHLPKGDNVKYVEAEAKEDIKANTKADPDKANITTIQQMISAILTYFNLIPGVSVNKLDTTGHGEGKWRGILLRFEKYGDGASRSTIENAIKGLRDGGIKELHDKYIAEAYPISFNYLNDDSIPEKEDKLIQDEDLDRLSVEAEPEQVASTALNETEKRELEAKRGDSSWLTHVNNCLINAITDAAGVARADADTIIRIRQSLGAPVGEMLAASTTNLDIILRELGLIGWGVVVVYQGETFVDESSNADAATPLFIYHDGINHFTPLYGANDRKKKKGADKEPGKKDDTGTSGAEAVVDIEDDKDDITVHEEEKGANMSDIGEEEESLPADDAVSVLALPESGLSGDADRRKRKRRSSKKNKEEGSSAEAHKKAKSALAPQQRNEKEKEQEEEDIVTETPAHSGPSTSAPLNHTQSPGFAFSAPTLVTHTPFFSFGDRITPLFGQPHQNNGAQPGPLLPDTNTTHGVEEEEAEEDEGSGTAEKMNLEEDNL